MQGLTIRSMVDDDIAALQRIRKQAFRPIFESFRGIVGRDGGDRLRSSGR